MTVGARLALAHKRLSGQLEPGDREGRPYDLDADLHDLLSRGLLHRDHKTNRFDLHPIVRRYAYDRRPATTAPRPTPACATTSPPCHRRNGCGRWTTWRR